MKPCLICFSHLRWNFVYQRPQHLMTRFSKWYTVYYFEEPVFEAVDEPTLRATEISGNLTVLVPLLSPGTQAGEVNDLLSGLLATFLSDKPAASTTFWYYTPMALPFSRNQRPAMIIYDCMDELSAFDFAPKDMRTLEAELLSNADLVFTGGNSLYEAKKDQHPAIHPFPSSIELQHFRKAREIKDQPADQSSLAYPRLGFYGVLDERFDKELIREISAQHPEWQIVLIGPVAKIDPATLPDAPNIHYLGQKTYQELPAYLSGWDVAMIPFLLNDSTRFISPTKTPEYLAAGVPVVSTPIRDVVHPYGAKGFVRIGEGPADFIAAIAEELVRPDSEMRLKEVDFFLAFNSWDKTCDHMLELIAEITDEKSTLPVAS